MLLTFALLLSCVFTGLIWYVQIVHYPLFLQIPSEVFPKYEFLHQKRTGLLVIPLMLAELTLAICLIYLYPLTILNLGQLGLTCCIWISTLLIQSPIHQSLLIKKSEPEIKRLIKSNWLRTVAWTVRSIFLFQMAVF